MLQGCGIAILILGAALAITVGIVGFITVPNIIENTIIDEVILRNDTIQLERFREIPFPLDFTIRLFNVTNRDEVLSYAVPIVEEVGPYVYKLYRERVQVHKDDYTISYQVVDRFEFDSEASYPNTEEDYVTIINVPYHAILQVAEATSTTMGLLNQVSSGIFGAHNTPITTVSVRDLLFDGIPICQGASGILTAAACLIIRNSIQDSDNMRVDEDNTVWFSFFYHKNGLPSDIYEVDRGLTNYENLGRIITWGNRTRLEFWSDEQYNGDTDSSESAESSENGENGSENGETRNETEEDDMESEESAEEEFVSVCNMLNGTDTGIFRPFLTTDLSLDAFNPDICRSVELRYQGEVEYKDVVGYRFALNDWLLNNDEGCFCLNVTQGITQPNGCLHRGAIELFTCTGSFTVLTYPHFLFADFEYLNGVVGAAPDQDMHRIYLDLEPNSGTVLRGAKRVQFNIFSRPITSITATQNLRTTLFPILWIEESIELPDEFVDEIKTKLLRPLWLVEVLRGVLLGVSALLLIIGIIMIVVARRSMKKVDRTIPTTTPEARTT